MRKYYTADGKPLPHHERREIAADWFENHPVKITRDQDSYPCPVVGVELEGIYDEQGELVAVEYRATGKPESVKQRHNCVTWMHPREHVDWVGRKGVRVMTAAAALKERATEWDMTNDDFAHGRRPVVYAPDLFESNAGEINDVAGETTADNIWASFSNPRLDCDRDEIRVSKERMDILLNARHSYALRVSLIDKTDGVASADDLAYLADDRHRYIREINNFIKACEISESVGGRGEGFRKPGLSVEIFVPYGLIAELITEHTDARKFAFDGRSKDDMVRMFDAADEILEYYVTHNDVALGVADRPHHTNTAVTSDWVYKSSGDDD